MIDDGTLLSPLAVCSGGNQGYYVHERDETTCSSKILENLFQPLLPEAVLNLEKAGAVIIGKTNMDEFAMGSTTETSYLWSTRNPWNLEHVPGGS